MGPDELHDTMRDVVRAFDQANAERQPTVRVDIAIVLKAEFFQSDEHARDFVRSLIARGMNGDIPIETFVILSTERRDGR